EGDAGGEVRGKACSDQDGCGVEEDDVAMGAGFAGEDGGEDASVSAGVAALEGFDGGASEADVFGGEGGEGDGSVADFGEVAGAGDGELIHSLRWSCNGLISDFPVDYEGVASVEQGHRVGDLGDEV